MTAEEEQRLAFVAKTNADVRKLLEEWRATKHHLAVEQRKNAALTSALGDARNRDGLPSDG